MASHNGASSSYSYSSGSSSSSSTSCYDVFLSFRGEDTRNTFTGFLHSALERENIKVFIDSEDLWGGEEIQPALFQAIRGSKISITVFSKGYADSKWCLRELVKIVECHRSSNGQIILPVFFDVEPTDVRHQTGKSFEESFQKHKLKFDPQTIESWKVALTFVAGISGYELKQVNGNQSKLVCLVVDGALRALSESSGSRLGDVKNAIGLDARVKEMEDLLNVGSNDVRFVGICGIGGIGKTTIAKALYNRIFNSFHSYCFLANIRETASSGPNGLVSLQEQLICSVSKNRVDHNIWNVDGGQELIKNRLKGVNVLLILDDVDDRSHLKAFAIEFNWFGTGSRIIITSRDEHILNVAKVDGDNIYRAKELNDKQSLQLFSLHAFSSDQPPPDYKQLSHDVLRLAGGLPLTLEVLGSYFSDITEKEVWLREIEQLKRLPHEDVLNKLKISFDNLKAHEKSMFLDVACFFVGWRKEIVISFWDACGFDPILAIKKLTQRSLIKFTKIVSIHRSVETYDELRMHDQIQAMGRGIVLGESPREPGMRSRLWSHAEILEVLEEHKGTQMIEGILLPPPQSLFFESVCLCRKDFEMMSKLRFFSFDGGFEGDFPHLPLSLIWFSWRKFAWEILPANFYLKKLVHIDLSHSMIRQAWTEKPQNENQGFPKLKVLRLRFCDQLSESPDFSWFPYLETLDLGWCRKIVNLHKSIGDLQSLVELHVDWTKIEELPNSIGRLSSLKRLILSGCLVLKNLPDSISGLKSLVQLSLDWTQIERLPNSTCRLSSLEILRLDWCERLNKLPESIGDLKSLVELSLHETQIKELPNSICSLSSLERLELNGCESLNKLPESFGDLNSLVELSLDKTHIKELPNCDGLEKLEVLSVRDCDNLVKLPISWWRVRCLRFLNLDGNTAIVRTQLESSLPPWIICLPQLQKLVLRRYGRLESLSELPSTLITLVVDDCISLQKLPDFSNLKNLRKLSFDKCRKLVEIQGLEANEFLEEFIVRDCEIITDTPRKIHGQGTLLVEGLQGCDSLIVNNGIYKGLALCVVFAFTFREQMVLQNLQEGELVVIGLYLNASIRGKYRRTRCEIKIPIEGVEFTTERDIIYIHHFKGFDWFGFPLEGADAIEKIRIKAMYYWDQINCEVKFWKLLLENTESEQKMCNRESSSKMVANFFNWSYDDAGRYPSDTTKAAWMGGFLDSQAESSNELDSHYVPETRDSDPSTNEGTSRAGKRARLDVDDEAGGPFGA